MATPSSQLTLVPREVTSSKEIDCRAGLDSCGEVDSGAERDSCREASAAAVAGREASFDAGADSEANSSIGLESKITTSSIAARTWSGSHRLHLLYCNLYCSGGK
jgi:hypothetical protein